ncbi:MAG TPA: hypothetical protein VHO25_16770 [Polyangiaceae bacterium]|nr:hypothetical protein [Polyangiaceae bacterium]
MLNSPGGRCPSCGALQPGLDDITQVDLRVPQAARASVRPRPQPTPAPPPKKTLWPLWILLILLVTVVTLAVVRGLRLDEETEMARAAAAEAAARAKEEPPAVEEPKTLRLVAAWADALKHAQGWNRDAVLVRMEASGLDAKGILTLSQGSARFEYGVRALGEALARLPRVGKERLVVKFDASGTKTETLKGASEVSSSPEPDCLPEEAVRIGPASDFPAESSRTVSYAFNAQLDKAVWTLSDTKDTAKTRMLDGQSCNVIVR